MSESLIMDQAYWSCDYPLCRVTSWLNIFISNYETSGVVWYSWSILVVLHEQPYLREFLEVLPWILSYSCLIVVIIISLLRSHLSVYDSMKGVLGLALWLLRVVYGQNYTSIIFNSVDRGSICMGVSFARCLLHNFFFGLYKFDSPFMSTLCLKITFFFITYTHGKILIWKGNIDKI